MTLKRYVLNEENKKNILNDLLKRSTSNYPEYEKKVADICEDVKARKDEALFEYTLKFDKFALNKTNI
ncbi:MAG: histidinol dehydrogenase, partial [Lachnospiraceae bacterium]|nr:histidinol dehydrogenase [Lachnospiraceae bacterium]